MSLSILYEKDKSRHLNPNIGLIISMFAVFESLCQLYTLVCHTLPAPSVDTVERAVATFDDGGIGVLADGTVFQRQQGVPMLPILAHGHL